MSTSGVAEIEITETRPRRPWPCLNCDKPFPTTPSARLCPTCTARAQRFAGGVDEAAVALGEPGGAAAGAARAMTLPPRRPPTGNPA